MTPSPPSPAVMRYGTEEPVAELRVLTAGKLSVELDAGNLRHIRWGGLEVIRAVSFIVRDRDWSTCNPTITGLAVDERPGGFTVRYEALARDRTQRFRYHASIAATADGTLLFEAEGVPETDFLTNRTGFVVLHPIIGVAGEPVTVERVDGTTTEAVFPRLIDPVQPMMDLRALTHRPAPGVCVTCRMEGDTYEMEDQRNWADASFKTYVRPLARPWPYTLPKGETLAQSVRIEITGPAPAQLPGGLPVTLALGDRLGPAPRLGVGLDPDDIQSTLRHAETFRELGAAILVCHYDPRRGHGAETLAALADTAHAIGAEPWLEAVLVEVEHYAAEIGELGRLVGAAGSPFATVLLSPAPDMKCTLPGSPWPPAPPAEGMFQAARVAFPGARLGGGMFSFFTELNRKRPPTHLLDLVSFTTIATMHAGDDHSVMEGIEALPAIADTARHIAGGVPFVVGPSAIGMRHNPYGEAPVPNPGNVRQAMTANDPRQRGLLGAAWACGVFARFAYGGAAAITLGATTGPFGVLHTPTSSPAPWFDRHGGVYPMYHAIRALAALNGATMMDIVCSDPAKLAAVAVTGRDGASLLVANLTPETIDIALPAEAVCVLMLDEQCFVAATFNTIPARPPKEKASQTKALGPFAVATFTLAPCSAPECGSMD